MKILTFIKNDSLSISPQTNRNLSVIEKIKNVIGNVISFIQKHTSCMHTSEPTISKQVITPLNLSHEILRVLDEEKNSQGSKKDLDFITFFFDEAISDSTKDIATKMSIYDVPKNNKPVLEELNYTQMYMPTYDIPSNKPIYDTPKSNRPISEEPIYEEIDDSRYGVDNRRVINDIPPPLPPRKWSGNW